MVAPLGFSLASLAHGACLSLSHLEGSLLGFSLGAQWAMPARSRRAITWSISSASVSMAPCGVFSPVTAWATFFHQSWASLGESGTLVPVGDQATRAGLRENSTRPPSLGARSVMALDCMSLSRIGVRPTMVFLSEAVLAVTNCAYSQAAAVRSGLCSLKKVHEPTSW